MLDLRPIIAPEVDTIDNAVSCLVAALTAAANTATPTKVYTCRSKPGYTPEIKHLKQLTRRARRRAKRIGREADWEHFCKARHKLTRETAKLNRSMHRERIEEATTSIDRFWKLARWACTRDNPRPTFTPALRSPTGILINNPEEKAHAFRQTLFPEVNNANADYSNIRGGYPTPLATPRITIYKVRRAVHHTAPRKAPGPDGIPNLVLQRNLAHIKTWLEGIFNACIDTGYCPNHFRASKTVVLRKPGKDNYSNPKNYCLIALLSTIGKALEAIITSRISYLVECYGLLPEHHIGGRRGCFCKYALHLLLEQVHAAWRNRDIVATLLTLDISGAYDNVSYRRLLHNLRKRRVPEAIVQWISSFLIEK
ncbi:hypothetical protein EYZ11_006521 [Aspergillus tanneri]|uniref:Reverse transcriptase domain-containing protein n=1 Tax=Aspergillus tanneri TaxID=1220188 RepID=A0A4S3JFM9_9EURO|nr:hypothetical protein EYZ11_006521 [Aspergillus tanneri]